MLNYFELLGVPTAFLLDQSQLQHNFRTLQTQYHPDSFTADNTNQTLTQLKPEQLSAVINEAYQTLALSDSRATHLLALKDIKIPVTDSIHDLAFLGDAMEFRIALDEANSDELASLSKQLKSWLNDYENQFAALYLKLNDTNLSSDMVTQAIDITQKLKFLIKLERDVDKKRDELAAIHTDDDDLYV